MRSTTFAPPVGLRTHPSAPVASAPSGVRLAGPDADGRESPRSRQRRRPRRGAALAFALSLPALLLAGCGGEDRQPGVLGYVQGFAGAVVADEPRAVLVARDILSSGGTASDAAVAMGFTLAVTLPTAAGLGGGGVCLVQDRDADDEVRVEALDFLPETPAGLPGPGGAVAVPALPRGLFALHARGGVLRWESLVAPAENLARFGFPVSRALAAEVQALGGLPPTGGLADAYGPEPMTEGQRVQSLDLARALGQARVDPGQYYGGTLARELIAAAADLGHDIAVENLRDWRPQWRTPVVQSYGVHRDMLAPVPASAARFAERWAQGGDGGSSEHAALAGSLPGGQGASRGATGFVVADSYGGAVACALTTNRPFATEALLPGFGFALAPLPGPETPPLALLLRVNTNSRITLAGLAAAGAEAPTLALQVGVPALNDGMSPTQAVQQATAGGLGRALVSMVSCPKGIPPDPETCAVGVDPRGAGLGLLVGMP